MSHLSNTSPEEDGLQLASFLRASAALDERGDRAAAPAPRGVGGGPALRGLAHDDGALRAGRLRAEPVPRPHVGGPRPPTGADDDSPRDVDQARPRRRGRLVRLPVPPRARHHHRRRPRRLLRRDRPRGERPGVGDDRPAHLPRPRAHRHERPRDRRRRRPRRGRRRGRRVRRPGARATGRRRLGPRLRQHHLGRRRLALRTTPEEHHMTAWLRRATIDLAAYRANLTSLIERMAPVEVLAIVKADAYSLGADVIVPEALAAGIRWFGTVEPRPAYEMRRAGVGDEASFFAWQLGPDEDWDAAVRLRVDLGVSTIEQLESFAAAARAAGPEHEALVHLTIDTGCTARAACPPTGPPSSRAPSSSATRGRCACGGPSRTSPRRARPTTTPPPWCSARPSRTRRRWARRSRSATCRRARPAWSTPSDASTWSAWARTATATP